MNTTLADPQLRRESFGHPDRYHSNAASPPIVGERDPFFATQSSIEQLLREYDPELEAHVSRAFRQWNQIIRDLLRNEIGLRLSIGDEAQSVPVKVVAGLPAPLRDLVNEVPTGVWRFLLRLPAVEAAADGLAAIVQCYGQLDSRDFDGIPAAMPEAVPKARDFCRTLLAELQKIQIRRALAEIDQDILGAYFFWSPEIHLHWMVIGLVAGILGISVEALTVVVAAHELAHSYSHMGRDIDGGRWETTAFARADVEIIEGIAQFYTRVVCEKLQRRNPSAISAYAALLQVQGGPYRVHEGWVLLSDSRAEALAQAGEIVRACLIECRNKGLENYADFRRALGEYRGRISRRTVAAS